MSVLPESEVRELARVGAALADPTRRALYRFVVEQAEPVAAAEAGQAVGVHRTVARAHLQRLALLGLLRVESRRRSGGGRPARVYAPSDEPLLAQLPPRRYERLAGLLIGALKGAAGDGDAAVALAAMAGWRFGRAEVARLIAAEASAGREVGGEPQLTPLAAQHWLNEGGFRATVVAGSPLTIDIRNCVFREQALLEPAITCGIDKAVIRALFAVPEGALCEHESIARGDARCVLTLTL
jgi:predicted ArsR family transcriptional regulator